MSPKPKPARKTSRTKDEFSEKKIKWDIWLAVVALLLAGAGYTLKDFIGGKELKSVANPMVQQLDSNAQDNLNPQQIQTPSSEIKAPLVQTKTGKAVVPRVLLLWDTGRLNLFNKGKKDIYLWGTKLGEGPPDIEKEPQLILIETFYYIFTDRLENRAFQLLGENGEQLIPFEVFLTDLSGRQYIAKFNLFIKNKNGEVTINTQQMGVSEGRW